MRCVFIILSILCLATNAQSAFKNCESMADLPVQYRDGAKPFHELTIPLGTMKVGGVDEKYPKNVDHLAVQRALLHCAPGILKCFKDQGKLPAELLVSFLLNPAGNSSTASDFKYSSKNKLLVQVEQCLSRVLSEAKFGLILVEPGFFSMPVGLK